jgi:Kef-type K+ transport system membrane component KefB
VPVFAIFAASPEVVALLTSLLVVFASTKLLGELCEKVRLPGIVGALVAGILIGPSALNLIEENVLLHALSELGVMFLLFLVGLEVKASDMLRVGRTALIVAIMGVALPFVMGWGLWAATGHASRESIFIGAALVATSVGITAQVLSEMGLLAHRTSQIILAAAVIDDVLGLLVLAVVSGMGGKGGVDYYGIATTAALSLLLVVAAVKWGTPAVSRMLPKVRRRLRAQEAEFSIAMIFLFGMALVAVYSGVAAIIGAFLAGLVLAESVGRRVHDLAHGAGELLIPFFLTGIGLRMDLAVFKHWETLLLALAILLIAVVSKWGGCALGAAAMGWRDATRIGVGMVPRGEVGMVVAQIGLAAGVIGKDAYGVAVFMAVATTIVAPPLLFLVYRDIRRPASIEEQRFHLG